MGFSDVIVKELSTNALVFESLLASVPLELSNHKEDPKKWSLLEIACHLADEEVEDFRTRVKHTLETPDLPLKSISPQLWPISRKYSQQNYHEAVNRFLTERRISINWLKGLIDPQWSNTIDNKDLGNLSAQDFLENWLAHDYLHIRQINQVKRSFLARNSHGDLGYAGNW
ncbi:DinB family protein [Croceitalea sp. MTPC5]|uniref:DinB family protein n=1 Tax=Croceitalea sp. MTPC5 TaxID=3056565 RepID=UPI002B37502B|nr:DinB family protein [Croceitalea sp. MTPC5]